MSRFPGRRRGAVLVLAVVAALVAAIGPAGAAPEDPAPGSGDRTPVIVRLSSPTAPADGPAARIDVAHAADAVIGRAGIPDEAVTHTYELTAGFAAEVTGDELASLEADPRVDTVFPDRLMAPALDDKVALVDADVLHDYGYDGSSWTIAVLDTGFELSHPFLSGSTGTGHSGSGVVEACFAKGSDGIGPSGNCPGGGTTAFGPGASVNCVGKNGCGHGTSVAGVAVGAGGNDGGILLDGMAPDAGLFPVRVFSEFSSDGDCGNGRAPCVLAWTSDTLAGLDLVYAQRANYDFAAVNLSLGSGGFTSHCDAFSPYTDSIGALTDAGIAVVVASGNDSYSSRVAEPACVESAIAVTATTTGDAVAGFANADDTIDLAAPGVTVRTSNIGADYTLISGTSFSSPMVAGAYGILREAFPAASLSSLTAALKSSPVLVSKGSNTFPRIDLDHAFGNFVVPAAPSDASATASPGTATISWTWTPDSAAAPKGFRITDNATGQAIDAGTGTTSKVWTGLPHGTRTFSVAAVSAAGTSSSVTTNSVTVTAAPGAPTALTVRPVLGGIEASWKAPASNGGTPITGYTVTAGGTTKTVTTLSTTFGSLPAGEDVAVTVAATNAVGTGPSAASTGVPLSATAGAYTAAGPVRVVDTRFTPDPKPGAGQVLTVPIAGTNGVPADATAVVVNLTGVDATNDGFVAAYPSGTKRPTASNLNLTTGETRPNLAIVPLGTNGAIDLYTQSGAHLIVDLAGYWRPATVPATTGRYASPATPTRIVDTRFTPDPKPGAGQVLTVPIAGTNGVPADATAVVVNLTGVDATNDGFVAAYPSGTKRPTASNLNLTTGETRPNLAIVPLGTNGAIDLYTQSGAHLIIDLAGWFSGSSAAPGVTGLFTPVTPARALDTRFAGGVQPVAGTTVMATVVGVGGVPTAASAVAFNLTGVEPLADGFVTAYPTGLPRPTASNLNLITDQTAPNAALVARGNNGTISLFTQRGAHLIVDLAGWFS